MISWPNETRRAAAAAPSFRFVDLFAGIGGLRLPFQERGGDSVFTSEWDRFSNQTYRANFGDEAIAGDIRAVRSAEIPDFDLLLAGFPCQPFSIAGVSKKNALGRVHGFACEAQGTLFFEVARIIHDRQPRAFLLENVKNLLSHDHGNTFRVIMRVLQEELGYTVSYKIFDAKAWLPQHRERVFIAGFREPNAFSLDDVSVPDLASGPRLASILHPEDGSQPPEFPFTEGPRARVAEKYTLSDKLWAYLQAYAARHREAGHGFGFGLVDGNDTARTLSARYFKDGSEILLKQKNKNPRRLTPRECAGLMGFDAPGGAEFIIPVSDTQAYRQFGNSVAVPVVRAVAAHMIPWLLAPLARQKARARA